MCFDVELRALAARLDAPLAEAWSSLKTAAAALTAARRKTGKDFARAVQAHMKALCLPEARIGVEVEPLPLGDDPLAITPPEDGADTIRKWEVTGPTGPVRELLRILAMASGRHPILENGAASGVGSAR